MGGSQFALISPELAVISSVGAAGVDGMSSKVIESDLSEVDPAAPAAVTAVTVNSFAEPLLRPVTIASVEDPDTSTFVVVPTFETIYAVTSYPPRSVASRAVHVTVARPTPLTAVGFAGALGKVLGIAVRVFVDHALASTPVKALT